MDDQAKRELRKQFVAHKALFINEKGEILLLKSSAASGTGEVWDFPGGQMEAGEHPLDALVREVSEETGLLVDQQKARLFFTDTAFGFGSMADIQVVKLFYIVPFTGGDIRLSEEHTELIWVDPRKPFAKEISGFVLRVLEAYRRHERISLADKRVFGFEGYGLIQLIHGNGKGKTTAALGQSIRAAGAGKRVAIVYFDKGGSDHYNERLMIDQIDQIDYWATGRDRIDKKTGRFDFSINDIDKLEAQRGLDLVCKAFHAGYDLVVMDEINSTTDLGMVSENEVLGLLDEKPPKTELIMTGRNPLPSFIERAHLVTEMRLERHYFYSGVKARAGLDY